MKLLTTQSAMSQPNAVVELARLLNQTVTYSDPSNVDTNKKLWNNYAKDWFV
jgi:hypothetical protein